MADVFVSYARVDKARVAPIVAAIEAQGWSVWWDPEIAAGQLFDDQIEAQLAAAKCVLVVWTPTSVASRWVRGEAREAADRGILVPVRFEEARLPMDVRALHTTDLDKWADDPRSPPFQEVLRALGGMMARNAAPRAESALSGAPAEAAPKSSRVSICVLPFANMSGDAEQEYFSDGISEDIITDLSKVSSLAVVSRNTAFSFKGRSVDIAQIGRQLKVAYVLEGSVRKAAGRVRITAQLIEVSKDNHVWAERYDRDLSDIFALQDEISQAIVKALKLKLLPGREEGDRAARDEQPRGLQPLPDGAAIQRHRQLRQRPPLRGHHPAVPQRDGDRPRLRDRVGPDGGRPGRPQVLFQRPRGRRARGGRARARAGRQPRATRTRPRARVLTSESRYDEALVEIDAALATRPGVVRGQLRPRPACTSRSAACADAIRYYEKAAALMETDFSSVSLLMTCYKALGDVRERSATPRSARWPAPRRSRRRSPTTALPWAMSSCRSARSARPNAPRISPSAPCCSIRTT